LGEKGGLLGEGKGGGMARNTATDDRRAKRGLKKRTMREGILRKASGKRDWEGGTRKKVPLTIEFG